VLELKEQFRLSNLSEYEGMGIRAIMRKTGHHYQTVKKYIDKEDWNVGYKPRKQRASKLEPLMPTIDKWLREDMTKRRKDKRAATKIFNDLQKDEELSKLLEVSKQTVLNYVSKRKKELYSQTYKTAMYTLHAMCEAQVDFGDVTIIRGNGAEETWHELVLSFPWSNAGFAQLCRNETKECLCEALQRIFEYIGGVPLRILFDNMSSVVIHIEEYGERKLTDTFMRFAMHHRFKADFCNPDSPHEKGNVENKVGYLRRNYLLPAPIIVSQTDLEAFNQRLLDNCMTDLEREHYSKKELICDLFAEEQQALSPLPKEKFRVFRLEKVKTDKYSLVQFEHNKYSTSPEYPKREMWLEIGTLELRILNEDYEEIAAHERRYERESQPIFDFKNYVSTLIKRPRAFLDSPYFLTLPVIVQNHLKSCPYKDLKQMLLLLLPIIQDGKIGDAEAVLELLEIRNTDEFNVAYRALTEDTRPLPSVTTMLTPIQQPYLPKLTMYSALQGGFEEVDG